MPSACVSHIPGSSLPGYLGSAAVGNSNIHVCPSTTRPVGGSEKDRLRRTASPCSRMPAVGPRALDSPLTNATFISHLCVYVCIVHLKYICMFAYKCALTYFLNYLKPCFRHPYTSCLNSSAYLTPLLVSPQAFLACLSNLILMQSH